MTTLYRMPKVGELVVLTLPEPFLSGGTSLRIWSALMHAYLIAYELPPDKLPSPEATEAQRKFAQELHVNGQVGNIMYSQNAKPLWALATSSKLNRVERMLLAWTFDHAVCEYTKLTEMATLLRDFDKQHPVNPEEKLNFLPNLADLCEREAQEPEHLGLIMHGGDFWVSEWRRDVEGDEEEVRKYDASKDEGHFFIFEKYDKEPALKE